MDMGKNANIVRYSQCVCTYTVLCKYSVLYNCYTVVLLYCYTVILYKFYHADRQDLLMTFGTCNAMFVSCLCLAVTMMPKNRVTSTIYRNGDLRLAVLRGFSKIPVTEGPNSQ